MNSIRSPHKLSSIHDRLVHHENARTHAHTHTHTHIYICLNMCISTYAAYGRHTYILTNDLHPLITCTRILGCDIHNTHTYTYTYTHTYITHKHIYQSIHTYIHIHTYICIHTYIQHTNIHTLHTYNTHFVMRAWSQKSEVRVRERTDDINDFT